MNGMTAMVVPCIDLMDGKVVQFVQGREKALNFDTAQAAALFRKALALDPDFHSRSRTWASSRRGPRAFRWPSAPPPSTTGWASRKPSS